MPDVLTPTLPAGPVQHAFHAFLNAADTAARAEAFASLIREVRPGADGNWKGSALGELLAAVEPPGESRDRFGAALAALLAETDATNLVACAGIPGHRGFFSEFGDRLANRILPSPADGRDLRELVHRLYGSDAIVRGFGGLPLDLFHRVAGAFTQAPPPGSWDGLRAAFADGFRLLLSRVETEGLSPKVRARASAGPVSASPFHRIEPRARPCWRLGSRAAIRRTRPCGSGRSRASAARRPASSSSISRALASVSTSSSPWR